MPVTALSSNAHPATHKGVLSRYIGSFEEHGRSKPLALFEARVVYGANLAEMLGTPEMEVLVMATKQSLTIAQPDGVVSHYMRLSEIDSIVVKDDLILCRGCPRVARGEDVLLKLPSEDIEDLIDLLRTNKQGTFRLPLPVVHTQRPVETIASFASPCMLEVLLWELPKREDGRVDVRPESPKQAKALLSLHNLRRELSDAEGGLRGGVEAVVARRVVALPSPPRQVSLCSIDSGLEPFFAPLHPIFVRVVTHLCSKTEATIAERVIAVCRDTILLCDTSAIVCRMLRYEEIAAVQIRQKPDGAKEDILIVRAIEGTGEAPLALLLTDDKRNIHRGGYSLINAIERAAMDAKCDIHFIRGGDHDATMSLTDVAESAEIPEELVTRVCGSVDNVTERDLYDFAEEINENASDRCVSVARNLLETLAKAKPAKAVSFSDTHTGDNALRLQNQVLAEEVASLKRELDAMSYKMSETNVQKYVSSVQADCSVCETRRGDIEALNEQLYEARNSLSSERREKERLEDELNHAQAQARTTRIFPTACAVPADTDTPPATPPQRPMFALSPHPVNPREENVIVTTAATSKLSCDSFGSEDGASRRSSLSLVKVDTIFSRLDLRPASPSPSDSEDDLLATKAPQRREPPTARLANLKRTPSPDRDRPDAMMHTLSFKTLDALATPEASSRSVEVGSCAKALGESLAPKEKEGEGRNGLQEMLQRSRDRRAQRGGGEAEAAQSLSLQAILERSRLRQSKHDEELEDATAPPQASSSPKGYSATPPASARPTTDDSRPLGQDVVELQSALQDYVCTVDLSPNSYGAEESPEKTTTTSDDTTDPFAEELAFCGLTAEEQLSLKGLGICNRYEANPFSVVYQMSIKMDV